MEKHRNYIWLVIVLVVVLLLLAAGAVLIVLFTRPKALKCEGETARKNKCDKNCEGLAKQGGVGPGTDYCKNSYCALYNHAACHPCTVSTLDDLDSCTTGEMAAKAVDDACDVRSPKAACKSACQTLRTYHGKSAMCMSTYCYNEDDCESDDEQETCTVADITECANTDDAQAAFGACDVGDMSEECLKACVELQGTFPEADFCEHSHCANLQESCNPTVACTVSDIGECANAGDAQAAFESDCNASLMSLACRNACADMETEFPEVDLCEHTHCAALQEGCEPPVGGCTIANIGACAEEGDAQAAFEAGCNVNLMSRACRTACTDMETEFPAVDLCEHTHCASLQAGC